MRIKGKGEAAHVIVLIDGPEAQKVGLEFMKFITNARRERRRKGEQRFGFYLETLPEISAAEEAAAEDEEDGSEPGAH